MTYLLEFCWQSLAVKPCSRSTACSFCYLLIIISQCLLVLDSSTRRQSEFVFYFYLFLIERGFLTFSLALLLHFCLPWLNSRLPRPRCTSNRRPRNRPCASVLQFHPWTCQWPFVLGYVHVRCVRHGKISASLSVYYFLTTSIARSVTSNDYCDILPYSAGHQFKGLSAPSDALHF